LVCPKRGAQHGETLRHGGLRRFLALHFERHPAAEVRTWRFVILAGLGFVLAMAGPSTVYVQGPGGPAGVDLKIRAQNRSTTDTPFCGIGGGMVGDRLDVDAFMDTNGVVTGRRGFRTCENTQSTFTPGVDKLTMEIKFR
jgi:hypothetical protein